MILDSSFLIDLMNGEESAVMKAAGMTSRSTTQRIPVRTIQELYVGVGYREDTFDEAEKIQSVTENRSIVETTLEIAKLAGRIDGTLRSEGTRIPPGDLVIGATARRFQEPVLTANIQDFERIPEVEVRTY